LSLEENMPVYEYICHDCHHCFEAVLTLKEHDSTEIRCPRCDSKNVEQDVAEFFAVTARKS
jgi:putative FmdB family regulatory protein